MSTRVCARACADKFGSTALHYAARGGHDEVVVLLVEANADHTIVNKAAETALTLAQGLYGRTLMDKSRSHALVVYLEELANGGSGGGKGGSAESDAPPTEA
jgi:ankyrin repeat protein